MSANHAQQPPEPQGVTLLALVTLLDRTSDGPDETEEAVHALLEAGRVRLTGSFRDTLALR